MRLVLLVSGGSTKRMIYQVFWQCEQRTSLEYPLSQHTFPSLPVWRYSDDLLFLDLLSL